MAEVEREIIRTNNSLQEAYKNLELVKKSGVSTSSADQIQENFAEASSSYMQSATLTNRLFNAIKQHKNFYSDLEDNIKSSNPSTIVKTVEYLMQNDPLVDLCAMIENLNFDIEIDEGKGRTENEEMKNEDSETAAGS